MDENNEDQCLKIPEMLKKCNFLEGNDKNTCIQNVRKLMNFSQFYTFYTC